VVSRIRRRSVLPQGRKTWLLSERRACEVLSVNRRASLPLGSQRCQCRAAIAYQSDRRSAVRYGQRRVYVLLRRGGWNVNIKRVARLYREEGLAIRTKRPRRRRAAVVREVPAQPTAANQSWANPRRKRKPAKPYSKRVLIWWR
jgi:putative transposase